ncbi:MAG: D-alanyl-D-alanine carboxypeptidase/D-alanyl-D-alanine-endopeptidase [Gemmatimonadota bacterium]|nr:D-alanyl-D-alanine carboxypeptidase/D-alanyl-D-alanine-endopeptidase [Gemmatimonadota bacterium]
MGRRSMKILTVLCAACLLSSCASTTRFAGRSRLSSEDLREEITTVLEGADLDQATVGIKVVSLRSGITLFENEADRLFVPASNTKLLTAVGALKALGSEYRFVTSLFLDEGFEVSGDTLRSNLDLKGSGNPEFCTEDLTALAAELSRFDIRYITGDVVADESDFDDVRLGSGWMWDDVQYDYSAQISALTLNRNCVAVTVVPGETVGDAVRVSLEPATSYMTVDIQAVTVPGNLPDSLKVPLRVMRRWRQHRNVIEVTGQYPVDADTLHAVRTVEDPAMYTVTVLHELLKEAGIQVTGSVRKDGTPVAGIEIAVHRSETLPSAVAFVLKDSDNLGAELLVKAIGAHITGTPGTARSGLQAMRKIMSDTSLDTLLYRQVDGSGLSTYNLISPTQIIDLLRFAYQDSSLHTPFLTGLPIAGIDGSLRSRMTSLTPPRNLLAKTGTMSGVSCLSGFVNPGTYEPLAFSIMINHYIGSSRVARRAQDEICRILAAYSRQVYLAGR